MNFCERFSTRRILYARVYLNRNYLTTKSFFIDIHRYYGKKPRIVIADGGTWYPDALQRLGIRLKIVSGDIKNYIERWYKTFKGRIKAFDKYFPHKEKYNHIKYWVNAFVFYYNFIRRHMSLGNKTPMEYHKEVLN